MLRARNVVDSQAAAAAAAAAASAAHARGHAPVKPYASRFAPGRTPSASGTRVRCEANHSASLRANMLIMTQLHTHINILSWVEN